MENHKKYRWFFTSSGQLVIGGKNAEQNEKLMLSVDAGATILHTALPGSPFCIIHKPSKNDIEETAIFCAKYSQAWKKAKIKKDVIVHVFLGKDVFKSKDMELGTFGVKKMKVITAKKRDIENFEGRKEEKS